MKKFSQGNILLVEDSTTDADIAMMSIRKSGLRVSVEWVSNGLEALAYLRQAKEFDVPVDLMILDLKMPLMNGWELLGQMKEEELIRFPIVVMSASEMPKDRERVFQLGANAFYVKPYSLQASYKVFEQLLNQWIANKEQVYKRSG
ncbi:MAG: response regulator [Bacteroidota bacterium]